MNPGGFIHTASGTIAAATLAKRQNANVTIQKFNFTDLADSSAFLVTDLDNADRSTGVVRSAKKILQDGAKLLARSQTYAWAVLGHQISGASAGISTTPEEHPEAVASFCNQVLERVAAGELSLASAKGVSQEEIAALVAADSRWSRLSESFGTTTLGTAMMIEGVGAAAEAVLGGIDGRRFAVEEGAAETAALVALIAGRGGEVTTAPSSQVASVEADALICGSRSGLIDHESAAQLAQKVIIPIGSTPITSRGLAVARRRGIRVLADFVTTSGPLLIEEDPAAGPDDLIKAVADRIGSLCSEFGEHPDGDLLAASYRAEEFLLTWRDELPFGRPIA